MKEKATFRPKLTALVNWAEIHRRLSDARDAIEGGWAPSAEARKAILKARAKILAQEAEEKKKTDQQIELVEFSLASERYGIESSNVREVYPLKELTPVPCTPPFVLGAINVRGQILSIIDIKKLFDLPEKGLTDLNKVIIVRTEIMELGLLADAVLGVRLVSLQDLQPSLPTLTGIRADYLKGVTQDRLVVLNAQKILADPKILVKEEAEV